MDLALAELRLAARLNPTNGLYPVMQADILLEQGRWEEARELLDYGIALEPNFLTARLLRAKLRLEAGQKGLARRELAEVFRRHQALPFTALHTDYGRVIAYFDRPRFDVLSAAVAPIR